jgi:GNAT superfamily N-acetyltransferase
LKHRNEDSARTERHRWESAILPLLAAPAGDAVARAIEVLRDEGLGIFWIKLVAGLGFYRRLVLQERPLDHAVPDSTPVLPMRIELLKESEVDDYLALRPDATRARVVARLQAGHLCFVARHEGRVISTCWATARRAWIEFLACEIDLTAGDAYLFDAFTAPRHRGQGVAPAVCLHQLRYLQQAGYRRAIRATTVENRLALRVHAKSGFRPTGTLGRLKIGPWQRFFRRPWPREDQSR